jgi:hypothetical protein
MRIVMIAENDPAGVGSLMQNALRRHTDHVCRLVTTQLRYNHLYEKDLHVPWLDKAGLDELASVLEEADVFHFHMLADEHMPLGPLTAAPFLSGKAVVHHHHGHHVFRSNPEIFQKKYRDLGRRNLLVSTPDLLPKLPGARWQPNLVPEHAPAYRPAPRRPDGRVRLGHSPTRKDLKNTEDLLAVHARLKRELPGSTWTSSTTPPTSGAWPASRPAIWSSTTCRATTACPPGVPVPRRARHRRIGRLEHGRHPRLLPVRRPALGPGRTPDELENALRRLATDEGERRRIGLASRSFMETVWSEKRLTAA